MSVARLTGGGVSRKTTAERTSMVPAKSSLVFDTDTLNLYVGDGTTTGGEPAPGSGVPITGVLHSTGDLAESVDGLKTFTENLSVDGTVTATNYIGSAELTGIPTAPTAANGTSTTQIATTAFVIANTGGGGGSTVPGGASGAIQYNTGTGFGGDASALSWDETNEVLTSSGPVVANSEGVPVYIGGLPGSETQKGGIWFNDTPIYNNHALQGDAAGDVWLRGHSTIYFQSGDLNLGQWGSSGLLIYGQVAGSYAALIQLTTDQVAGVLLIRDPNSNTLVNIDTTGNISSVGSITANSGGIPLKLMGFPGYTSVYSGVWFTDSPSIYNFAMLGDTNGYTYINGYVGLFFSVGNTQTLIVGRNGVQVVALTDTTIGLTVQLLSGQTAPAMQITGASSTNANHPIATIDATWVNNTEASQTGRLLFKAEDYTGTSREGMQISSDGTQPLVGFFGAPAVPQQFGDPGEALVALGLMSSATTSGRGDLFFDVTAYGAVADDGTTDNSIAFQEAVDAAIAALNGAPEYKGAVVYVPSAVHSYGVRKSTYVDCGGIEIRGEGTSTIVFMLGTPQPIFLFGIPRVQGGLSPDSTNRPDLYGKLDTSVAGTAGRMWGLRTNGNTAVQFHASPLMAGMGIGGNIYWSDNYSTINQFTIEFCVEPPSGQTFPAGYGLMGIGSAYNNPSPYAIFAGDGNILQVFFRTSDIEADNSGNFRGFNVDISGASPPYRVAFQFNFVNATCQAYINGFQVPLIGLSNMDPGSAIPFLPGVTFQINDYLPFMIGTVSNSINYGRPSGIDLSVYGLRLSNTLRYQDNGPGQPQVRIDSPETPLNDQWAYFGNDANTTCYLQCLDDPATAFRNVTVAHGQACYGSASTGYLMHTTNTVSNLLGNSVNNIFLNLFGSYGQVISLGNIYEFKAYGLRTAGGFQGIGSFMMNANYTVRIDSCTLDGSDSSYFGYFQIAYLSNISFVSSGRATMRFSGCAASIRNIFVISATPIAECIFMAFSQGAGGEYTIKNISVDFEGYSLSRAAIYCENHAYSAGTSLTLVDIFLGTLGQSTPIIMLKDMGVYGQGTWNRAWISANNIQAYTRTYSAILDIDGPIWYGEINGVALTGPPINHRQKWGTKCNIVLKDPKYTGTPNDYGWYPGAHVLDVRSPADGQYTQWRCVGKGSYGTSNPPKWQGFNPIGVSKSSMAGYGLNHCYATCNLT